MTDNQNVSGTNAVSRRKLLAGAGVLATSAAMAGLAQAQSAATPDGTVPGTAGRPRVALVTGSSRGIGAATARQLGRDGYRVVVNCVVNRDLAAQVARDIEASGSPAIWRQADVRDPAAVRALFDAGEEAFGGIDVVVANAGVMHLAPFADMSDEDVNHMFDVNILGSFHTLREAARRVRDGGGYSRFPPPLPGSARKPTDLTRPRKWLRNCMPPFWRRSWRGGTSPSMRLLRAWSTRHCSPTAKLKRSSLVL